MHYISEKSLIRLMRRIAALLLASCFCAFDFVSVLNSDGESTFLEEGTVDSICQQ